MIYEIINLVVQIHQEGGSRSTTNTNVSAIEGIKHIKTQARHPQTNGICEQLHRTMHEEFYAVVFRKNLYDSLSALLNDLDQKME